LIGESEVEFEKFLDGKVSVTLAGNLATATIKAFEMAKQADEAKPVVLLSPACASFDQFSSFEERGYVFKSLVEALPGEHQDPFEEVGLFPIKQRTQSTGEMA
jgi:UDP-N-acetylmuramoylalanine--D-glutamate ligase